MGFVRLPDGSVVHTSTLPRVGGEEKKWTVTAVTGPVRELRHYNPPSTVVHIPPAPDAFQEAILAMLKEDLRPLGYGLFDIGTLFKDGGTVDDAPNPHAGVSMHHVACRCGRVGRPYPFRADGKWRSRLICVCGLKTEMAFVAVAGLPPRGEKP